MSFKSIIKCILGLYLLLILMVEPALLLTFIVLLAVLSVIAMPILIVWALIGYLNNR